MTAPLINSGIILLENFLDSVHLLPTDLQRSLSYVRVLDEQIQELRNTADEKLALFVSTWQNAGRPLPPEAHQQRMEIDEMHAEIIHCQEEKIIYASQVENMLRSRVNELDEHKRSLESEIAMHTPLDVGTPTGVSLLREDTRGPEAMPSTSYTSEPAARMAPNPSISMPMPSRKSMKGQRKSPVGTPSHSQTGYMASMNGMPRGGAAAAQMGAQVPQMMMGHVMPNQQRMHGQMAMQYQYPVDPNLPVEFFAPIVPGMQACAQQIQARGHLLESKDISPALIGKQAELLWPDDGSWYLIKITHVDMAKRTANVQYITGEGETDLSLDEIARKGEMSIIMAN